MCCVISKPNFSLKNLLKSIHSQSTKRVGKKIKTTTKEEKETLFHHSNKSHQHFSGKTNGDMKERKIGSMHCTDAKRNSDGTEDYISGSHFCHRKTGLSVVIFVLIILWRPSIFSHFLQSINNREVLFAVTKYNTLHQYEEIYVI